MSDPTFKYFINCAVAYILVMVCLVESRPRSGVTKVGLAREAITDWLNMRGEVHPITNHTFPSINVPKCKEASTAPRILNHPRRSSNERINGGLFTDSAHSANSGSQPRKEDAVIFPSDGPIHQKIREDSFEPDSKMFKACADGSSYCEDIDNYPGRRVKELFENEVEKFKGFFGKDKVIEPSLVHRIDDPSEVPLCVSQETTVFPKVAKNEQNNLLYIVNEGDYMQGVRVEKCHRMGPCAFSDNFPNGYRAMCKQKHIYRRLLALNGAGQPQPDSFLFPSCCVCSVKSDAPLATRMGFPLKSNTTPVQRNNSPTNTKTTAHDSAENTDDLPAKNSSSKATIGSTKTSAKVVFTDHLKPLPLVEVHEEEEESR